jgi:hypothetical protein
VTADYECCCPDYGSKAPELENGMVACKHTLAIMLRKRSLQYLEAKMAATKPVVPEPQPVADPLPEAPASANVFIEMAGRKMQLTLRDVSEDKLIARMERLMARYPVQEAEQASSNGTPAPKNGSRKVSEMTDIPCSVDGCHDMLWRHWSEDGSQSWLSHKTRDGQWHKPSKR